MRGEVGGSVSLGSWCAIAISPIHGALWNDASESQVAFYHVFVSSVTISSGSAKLLFEREKRTKQFNSNTTTCQTGKSVCGGYTL